MVTIRSGEKQTGWLFISVIVTLNTRPLRATERKGSFFGPGFMIIACHGIVSPPP